MIPPQALLDHATTLLTIHATEIDCRRAISACYYALFHTLAQGAAGLLVATGNATVQRVTRTLNHSVVRRVCEHYVQLRFTPGQPARDPLVPMPPDQRLIDFAAAVIELQRERETADYDLATTTSYAIAGAFLETARRASDDWRAIADLPETKTFLATLLVPDVKGRRG